jgi:hypothetical protein
LEKTLKGKRMQDNTSTLLPYGSRFYEMCKERAINNQIMLTFANYGYLDMLLNWLYNISVKLSMSNYVIVSLDSSTHEALNEKGIGRPELFKFTIKNRTSMTRT